MPVTPSLGAAVQAARLRTMANDAIRQYGQDTAAGGEPFYPSWADDMLAVCDRLAVCETLIPFHFDCGRQIGEDAQGRPVHEAVSAAKDAPSRELEGRSDLEIVHQTEALAHLLMLEFYQQEVDKGYQFRLACAPRGLHCWKVACRIQELLTATDPENSVTELEQGACINQEKRA